MALGILPVFRKKGVYLVDSDCTILIMNLIAGSLVTQSLWVGPIHAQSICLTIQLALLVDPSISG